MRAVLDAAQKADVAGTVCRIAEDRVGIVHAAIDGTSDAESVARTLSRNVPAASAACFVQDSDYLEVTVFVGGAQVHSYVSDIGMLADPVETSNGIEFMFDGVAYAEDDLPSGPRGADGGAFLPLAIGDVDVDALTEILGSDDFVYAEERFSQMLGALGYPYEVTDPEFWLEGFTSLESVGLEGRPAGTTGA